MRARARACVRMYVRRK